jgi:uncharacterized membrane protein YccF (DUF307 family)
MGSVHYWLRQPRRSSNSTFSSLLYQNIISELSILASLRLLYFLFNLYFTFILKGLEYNMHTVKIEQLLIFYFSTSFIFLEQPVKYQSLLTYSVSRLSKLIWTLFACTWLSIIYIDRTYQPIYIRFGYMNVLVNGWKPKFW